MAQTRLLGSWELKPLPVARQYLEFSRAYLDAAQRLSGLLKQPRRRSGYARGAVVMSLVFHAVELFLKAAILQRSPREKVDHHRLDDLKACYRRLFHEPQFEWDIPFRIVDAIEPPQPPIEKQPSVPTDQVYRYPTTKTGGSWPGIFAVQPVSLAHELKRIAADLRRLESRIFVVQ